MTPQQLRAAMRSGRPVCGTLIVSDSPRWPATVAKIGLDFVFIDTEHIALDRRELSWMCQTYAALGLPPIVRIPSPDPYAATMVLDGGAAGVVAPYIETVEQVKALHGAVKLRPIKGARLDAALQRGAEFEPALAAYQRSNHGENILIINVESRPAMDNLDALLALDAVDGILIGPHDLSSSLGLPEAYESPVFDAAVRAICRQARARGVAAGIHSFMSVERTVGWTRDGLNFIVHSADILAMRDTLSASIAAYRAALGESTVAGTARPDPILNAMHFLPHRRARPLRLFLLASLAFGLAPVRAAAPDARKPAPAMFTHDELRRQFAYSVVAASGPDSPRNDSASVAELADRTLFLVWHKYRMNPVAGSDFGQADIAAKISCDGGATWTGERRLIEFAPGDLNIQAPAICALPNGELLLAALRAHAQNSSSMCLFRSGDQGLTWREAGKVWDHSRGQWLQGGTPSIVRLRSGRLVLPFHGGTGDQGRQHNTAGCFVSDDDGRSWRRTPAVIDLPMRGAMEASVAELASGRLLMSLRTQLGGVFLCESNDRAETWSLPWNAGVTAPESSSCLRRVGDSSALILLWNGCEFYEPKHHHYGQRSPLTLAWSGDDGRTWRRIGDLENDPESEFTNLNCLFTRGGDAVITYGVWSPAFNRKNPRRADQCAIVIPRTFWKQLR